MSLSILLLAAGASSRMGGADKLMEPVDGQPLLRRSAKRALATGLPVIAVLAPDRPARDEALRDLPLDKTIATDARLGMAHSIQAGLRALPDTANGAMMLMADMPDLTTDDLTALVAAFDAHGRQSVIRAASADGTPGAPTLVPRQYFPALLALTGDTGGKHALRDAPKTLVRLPGDRALTDLDTPEAWAAWRQKNP